MQEKEVILIRKQNTPFVVNYPTIDGRLRVFNWLGTNGNILDRRPVPMEVYNWLATYTTTFSEGMLMIDKSDDKEINEIKNNIEQVEEVEKSILTKAEIEKILTTGNQNVLKKELTKLTNNLSEELAENQKRYVVGIASEIGIDSSAKRKVIADWAGLDYENSDLIFDKDLKSAYEE